ncbi:helix-turn-helix transcriptional regulator [Phytomonospora sp. NPDC050363]|uniref:helix-turn-helix domain-containing protein n=1 Tax=Phytomonospora sp. NPDC050363 TaxID=3155642 RepID=UPI0033F17D0E
MPRRERVITTGGPLAAFARDLRELRSRAGSPTYRDMGEAVRYSHSVLCRAASGHTLPSWEATRAYLRACDVDETGVRDWRERHRRTKAALDERQPDQPGEPSVDDDMALQLLKQVTALVRSRNPTPASVASPQDFARAMRHLRLASDLSLREISRRTAEHTGGRAPKPVPVSTLADLCEPGRRTWPPAAAVAAFLAAIGVTGAHAAAWLDALEALRAVPAAETETGEPGWYEKASWILDNAERVVGLLRERPLSGPELASADAVTTVAGVAILADDAAVGVDTDAFDRLYCHLSNAVAWPVDEAATVAERITAAHRQGREAQQAFAVLDAARGVIEQHGLLERLARGRTTKPWPASEPDGDVALDRIRRIFTASPL